MRLDLDFYIYIVLLCLHLCNALYIFPKIYGNPHRPLYSKNPNKNKLETLSSTSPYDITSTAKFEKLQFKTKVKSSENGLILISIIILYYFFLCIFYNNLYFPINHYITGGPVAVAC